MLQVLTLTVNNNSCIELPRVLSKFMVVYLVNFDGSSGTFASCRRTVDTAGFAGDDNESGLVGNWPSEAPELPGLGLSNVRDRSGDDVKARTTGRAGSMTFACCLLTTGFSLQQKYYDGQTEQVSE